MNARRQRGVTLLELMVVVVIIAILAAIAVPLLSKSTRRARSSEVPTMFSKFKMRQEQYHVENGSYLSSGAGDADYFPAAPSGPNEAQAYGALPDSWRALRIHPDYNKLYCAYVSVAGDRGDGTNIGGVANSFGFNAPPQDGDWFYLIAECDFDGDPGVNALFFTSSDSTEIMEQNRGS
jgi:prepilin-type N-terminal cleavage/methylation domain-containing protein